MYTRRSIAAVVLLGLLLSTLLVLQASGAKFVATTSNSGNSATSDKLNAPTNLIAARGCTSLPSNRWVDLSWGSSPSPTNRYRIYRSVGGGAYNSLTTTTSLTYRDDNLANGTNYLYYIVAERSGTTWVSAASNTSGATTHSTICT